MGRVLQEKGCRRAVRESPARISWALAGSATALESGGGVCWDCGLREPHGKPFASSPSP